MKPWYEELFQDFAGNYDRENFTAGTIGEVDFNLGAFSRKDVLTTEDFEMLIVAEK